MSLHIEDKLPTSSDFIAGKENAYLKAGPFADRSLVTGGTSDSAAGHTYAEGQAFQLL